LPTETPHFNLPFKLASLGAKVVEQGELEDIANCVLVIVSTHVGERDLAPDLGVPDPTFRLIPIGADRIASVIGEQEPRASLVVTESIDQRDALLDIINIKISTVRGNN